MAAMIAQGLRNCDEKIVGVFYSRYMPCIYSYAYMRLHDEASAQDVAHDSVIAALRNINQLADDAKFDAWLWTIVRHEVLSFMRTRQRVVGLSDIVQHQLEVRCIEQNQSASLSHIARLSVQGLTSRDQEIFLMLANDDLSINDIALALNVSHENAQKLTTRFRQRVYLSTRALDAALYEKRCTELSRVILHWDGVLNPLWRKRISHHVENCALCGHRELVSMA